MEDNILIDEKYIHIDCEYDNKEDLLKYLTDTMLEDNVIKNTFYENILAREFKYPTGLNTGVIKVAIPHTNPEHVNEAAISDNPEKQVPLLVKLMGIFSQSDKLKEIKESKDKSEIKKIMEDLLEE